MCYAAPVFIGHFAAGMIGKRVAPDVGLGTHLVACQWLDFLWPVFLLTGIERAHIDHDATVVTPLALEHVPYSHSLVMSVVWSLAFFVSLKLAKRSTRDAAVVAAVVFSHFVLDVISHRPDMPLSFGPATLIVEGGLFALAVFSYARSTRSKDAIGKWSFVGLVAVLIAIYAANLFGPPPPEDLPAAGLAIPALAMVLFALLGWWADSHRERQSAPGARAK